MQNRTWKYYNHAALPNTAPHMPVDTSAIEDDSIWDINGNKPLLARWTTNFDHSHSDLWWFLIKDSVFDISTIGAKKRYEIKKGIKNFDTKRIMPGNYVNEILDVQICAFSAYPAKYRDKVNINTVKEEIAEWSKCCNVYGAFDKNEGKLRGYSVVRKNSDYYSFDIQKTDPTYEKLAINAALVYAVLDDIKSDIESGLYICDGERNINHETNFQDYLIKYFEFRKAYCDLNIMYSKKIKWLINVLKPFSGLLIKLDNISIIHNINAILKMQYIVDCQKGRVQTDDK